MSKDRNVPDIITEEYYQISPAILSSFPKYRPPLDLFVFNTKVMQLEMYCKKNTRITNEQVEEIQQLGDSGDIFVSRADHPVYSQHIIKQLDLVLVDKNLKENEVIDICINALTIGVADFFEQPVKMVYDKLYSDVMVTTEYLWEDKHRLKGLMRRLHTTDYTLANHSLNSFSAGLWLLTQIKKEELRRKDFDQAAIAFLLHDIGMSKVPAFILSKTTPLKPEEKEKIPPHPLAGYKILHKLDLLDDFVHQATMEHHERLDGSGYPQRSKNISFFGKLTAIVDAFSAMIQKRAYSEAKDPMTACKELVAARSKFDSQIASTLLAGFLSENFKPVKK